MGGGSSKIMDLGASSAGRRTTAARSFGQILGAYRIFYTLGCSKTARPAILHSRNRAARRWQLDITFL